MLGRMKKFLLGADHEGGQGQSGGVADIRLAVCALFLEMATTDGEFSGPERESILRILREDYQADPAKAAGLVEEADRDRKDSIDLWRFTRRINEHYSDEAKISIVEMLWRIVYADGHLARHED